MVTQCGKTIGSKCCPVSRINYNNNIEFASDNGSNVTMDTNGAIHVNGKKVINSKTGIISDAKSFFKDVEIKGKLTLSDSSGVDLNNVDSIKFRTGQTTQEANVLHSRTSGSLYYGDKEIAFATGSNNNIGTTNSRINTIFMSSVIDFETQLTLTDSGTGKSVVVDDGGISMTNTANMNGQRITGVGTATMSTDALSLGYADSLYAPLSHNHNKEDIPHNHTQDEIDNLEADLASKVAKTGDTMTGDLIFNSGKIQTPACILMGTTGNTITNTNTLYVKTNETGRLYMGSKKIAFVDEIGDASGNFVLVDGSAAMTGNLNLGTHRIENVVNPISDQDAATKKYVDDELGGHDHDSFLRTDGSNSMSGLLNMGTNGIANTDCVVFNTITGDSTLNKLHARTFESGTRPYFGSERIAYHSEIGNAAGNFLQVDGSNTMTGNLDLANNRVINVSDPVSNQDAATKNYVDSHDHNTFLKIDGSNAMTSTLNAGTNKISNVVDPTSNQDAATKNYVDSHDHNTFLKIDGSNAMTSTLNAGTNRIINVTDPTSNQDAATKNYVDSHDHNTFLKIDGSNAMTGDLNAGTNKITNVVDPTSNQDAATKNYVDSHDHNTFLKLDGTSTMTGKLNMGYGPGQNICWDDGSSIDSYIQWFDSTHRIQCDRESNVMNFVEFGVFVWKTDGSNERMRLDSGGLGLSVPAVMNNQKITGLGNATADQDALNRITADGRYVQIGSAESSISDLTVTNCANICGKLNVQDGELATEILVNDDQIGLTVANTGALTIAITPNISCNATKLCIFLGNTDTENSSYSITMNGSIVTHTKTSTVDSDTSGVTKVTFTFVTSVKLVKGILATFVLTRNDGSRSFLCDAVITKPRYMLFGKSVSVRMVVSDSECEAKKYADQYADSQDVNTQVVTGATIAQYDYNVAYETFPMQVNGQYNNGDGVLVTNNATGLFKCELMLGPTIFTTYIGVNSTSNTRLLFSFAGNTTVIPANNNCTIRISAPSGGAFQYDGDNSQIILHNTLVLKPSPLFS